MLNVAILGCGDMGHEHALAWGKHPDAKIVAVCDPDGQRCAKLATQFGADSHTDWQDAVSRDSVDVVSICTPVCFHRDLAVAAAEAGKHVLCEKPMALSLPDADDMIAAAQANGIQLFVCHQYRGLGHFRTMKRLIDDDVLGSPLHIRLTDIREVRPKLAMHRRDMNGGPVHDMSGHFFDLARYFTDREIVSVSAIGGVFGKDKQRLAGIEDPGIDTAEIQAMIAGGHCLTVNINWGMPEGTPDYNHEIIAGPKGVTYSTPALEGEFADDGNPIVKKAVMINDGSGSRRISNPDYPRGPAICVDDLVEAIKTGRPGEFDGRSGRAALSLVLAALKSIDCGNSVMLD